MTTTTVHWMFTGIAAAVCDSQTTGVISNLDLASETDLIQQGVSFTCSSAVCALRHGPIAIPFPS